MTDFVENRTTVAIKTEEAKAIEHPTLTFCMDPGTKTTVAEAYGYESSSDIFFASDIPNTTLLERFNKLSYILNDDFEILVGGTKLTIGTNRVTFQNQTLKFETQSL